MININYLLKLKIDIKSEQLILDNIKFIDSFTFILCKFNDIKMTYEHAKTMKNKRYKLLRH